MRMIENHVTLRIPACVLCHCWMMFHAFNGYGKVSYIRDGDVEAGSGAAWMECDGCEGVGELLRAKITQTTVIRAFLTQAKHALEDIELLDTDIDRIYGKIDDAIGDIERYERKVGTRDGQSE